MPRLISAVAEEAFLEEAQAVLERAPDRDLEPPPRLAGRILAAMRGLPHEGPTDLSGHTPFQREVLEHAMRIPRGKVLTYAELAEAVGSPRAVRAVGTALAKNRLPFLIPCHRVVRSDGRIGAYSGGGTGTKEQLLIWESAAPSRPLSKGTMDRVASPDGDEVGIR